MSTGHDAGPWGRVAEDGTVYVRTPDGERPVGSMPGAEPETALAHFARRYDELLAELNLVEARLSSGALAPRDALKQARSLRESLPTASVVGDLGVLQARAATLLMAAEARVKALKDARVAEAAAATDARRALAEEAEVLAKRSDWKVAGDRLRALIEEWKGIHGGDRTVATELWKRVSSARSEFGKRRDLHFANLEKERGAVEERKERLVRQAEALRESTEWKDTAKKYKDLMAEWKTAGRAARDVDDALWTRFRAAQDAFFTRRSEQFAKQDAELAANLAKREELLAEAERLEPDRDLVGAENRLRDIQERWEKVERVPREAASKLEDRLRAVEEKIRDVAEVGRRETRKVPDSQFLIRLRESVEALERKAARGDAQAAAELETKRAWLAQAEEPSGDDATTPA